MDATTEDRLHDAAVLLNIAESVASLRDPEVKRGLMLMLTADDSPTPTMIYAPKWVREFYARIFA